jgi:hypothetical protein
MPRIPVTAVKQRLQQALSELAELEGVIELVKRKRAGTAS